MPETSQQLVERLCRELIDRLEYNMKVNNLKFVILGRGPQAGVMTVSQKSNVIPFPRKK